ncbi:hypothetical protein Q5Z34_17295 [Listeria innocua]
MDEAPIVVPLKDQTLGLAGPSAVLRTAVQTILFQLSVLHSYRDVEFITLVPEADYQKEWSAWRWLPHTKIRHLNLRGIVHHAQSRDMVLNDASKSKKPEMKQLFFSRITFFRSLMKAGFQVMD